MPRLTVLPANKTVEYQAGPHLLALLQAAGFAAESPCGGRGTCGKCRVRRAAGDLPPPGESERALLSEEELQRGIRLACLVHPDSDLTVELADAEQGYRALTGGSLPEFVRDPVARKTVHPVPRPALHDQRPYEELVLEQTGAASLSLSALRDMPLDEELYTALLYGDRLAGVEAGDASGRVWGLAVDIGTTTVVTALVDLRTGRELGVRSAVNPQKEYGLDVLTRITYILERGGEGLRELQQAVVASINEMAESLCRERGGDPECVCDIVVAANSTMQHILLGVDPAPIGRAPFAPVFRSARCVPAAGVGLAAGAGARVYCLPSVSGYIGADIVAGAYVCGLGDASDSVLFIDIGTNGEIVLAHEGRLLSCSCAAGPALEGMNISSGMRAAEGAVEDVVITSGGVELRVIGGGAPQGLCGSGILAAVGQLLQAGLIRPDGRLEKPGQFPEEDFRRGLLGEADGKKAVELSAPPHPIRVTQKDIRQIQLAKGAILSGFHALLDRAGIGMERLDRVLIAGQFGSHLSAESLVGGGILPAGLEDRIEYVGNSSQAGATIALLSGRGRREMEALARRIGYMELSAAADYEKLFLRCLQFPKPRRTADVLQPTTNEEVFSCIQTIK